MSTILDADEALFEKLAKSLEDLKANKNQETFKKAVSSGDSIHSDLASQLSSLIKSAEPLDARFAKTLATFNTLLDERYAKLKSKNARVAEFVTSANPSADKKKEILAFMETSDKELKSLASKLGKLADEMDL